MEGEGNDITVEAEVHQGAPALTESATRTTRGRGRPPKNAPQTAAPQNVPKQTVTKKAQSTSKRLTVNALADRMGDMEEAQNARVDVLEREMQNTNAVLKGVGDTLKLLVAGLPSNNNVHVNVPSVTGPPVVTELQASTPAPTPVNKPVARQPPPATQTVQASSSLGTHNATHQTPALPPPALLVREQNQDGQLDQAMAREAYRGGAGRGKHYTYNEMGMAKPYMFIFRAGLQTVKQKLDERASMSMIEYINSTLLLLQDPDAFCPDDLPHILFHMAAVTTDAMVRPWHAVRTWSQYVWDCIERNKCNWNSYQFIQDERVRMSFISGTPSGGSLNANSSSKSVSNDSRPVLCRDYNSLSGCRHHGTHEEQGIKYLHACSHCDAMGRRSSHSYPRCRSKFEGTGQGQQGNYDSRQWSHNHGRQQYGQHVTEGNHGSQVGYRNGPGAQGNGAPKNL